MIFPFSEACSDLPLPAFANGVGQGHPGVLRAKGALQKYFYEMENRETLRDEKLPWGEDYPEIKSNMRLLWLELCQELSVFCLITAAHLSHQPLPDSV